MHPGQALARLNAKTVRFDIGRGGRSELDPQDIAAAVAMVPAGLGRELLCRVWWPDGAALTAGKLDAQLQDLQVREWLRRENLFYATTGLVAMTDGNDFSSFRARAKYKEAQGERWPRLILSNEPVLVAPTYAHIRYAVLEELAAGDLCPACSGRGTAVSGGKVIDCERCGGTGHHRPSERSRATACGLREHTDYLRKWRPVFEWLHAQCSDALAGAERQFIRVLR